MHELALATGAAGVVLGRDLRALSSVGLAAGTVRARVEELGITQAETLAPAPPPGLADVPAPNPTAAAAVRTALGQVGKPYRWGATGPAMFDCSGLVRFAYAHAGLSLPRTSRQQWSAGRHVQVADLRPGDLVFFAHDPADPSTIHHVGMYVGQGLMVHAPHTGALVRVDPVRPGGYAGATRPGRGNKG
jgi:cell wall-associated NlpC family hydrolase